MCIKISKCNVIFELLPKPLFLRTNLFVVVQNKPIVNVFCLIVKRHFISGLSVGC